MKAAVFRGPGQLAVEEIPYPELPADGLILKVEACGICGSDVRTYEHGMRFEREWQVLGHEIAGVVAEVGEEVTDYQMGDRLAVAADVHCHTCYYCRRALYNLCDDWKLIGAHFAGGLAEYMQMPEPILRRGVVHRTPDGLPSVHAALAEPASSVLAGQHQINVEVGEVVVIIGAGPIGCLQVQVARARGAKPILVGRHDDRLAIGANLGAWRVLNSREVDVVAEVRSLTNGLGADAAIVACASKAAQDEAVRMVRKRGRVVLFGGLPKNDPITHLDSNIIHYDELRVFGAFSYHPKYHQLALDLIAQGKIEAEKIITGTFPLEQVVEGLDRVRDRSEIKVIITPHE